MHTNEGAALTINFCLFAPIYCTPLHFHTPSHPHTLTELRSSLEERSTRVSELEQELEVLEGELSAAQQAAKQAPSRSLKALVERLRGQLAIKEKQQRVGQGARRNVVLYIHVATGLKYMCTVCIESDLYTVF